MAELNKGLLLIPQYSDSRIYSSSSLHLPGYKSEKQKDAEEKCHSDI